MCVSGLLWVGKWVVFGSHVLWPVDGVVRRSEMVHKWAPFQCYNGGGLLLMADYRIGG